MSNTFSGRLPEFPEIQIDYFRKVKSYSAPLASFLSHVHSDHLEGLENLYQGPFIYCSEATKSLFLSLQTKQELYSNNGVENGPGSRSANKFKYRHISPKLLKPLRLNYAHKLKFGNKTIQVTLIDANHCLGSVMFLFQNESGQSVLYTGDLRAEPWFLNTLQRNPCLVPYMAGKTKKLDCIYADTTFAYRDKRYIEIPQNMDGIQQLLECMENYKDSTIFIFTSLTLGYEEAILWIASKYNTKVHVDRYSYSLIETSAEYDSISRSILAYLTIDPYAARFHCCRKSSQCPIRERSDVVFLSPVVTYLAEEVKFINKPLDAAIFEAERLPIRLQQQQMPQTNDNVIVPADQQSIYIYADRRYVRGKDPSKLLPTKLMFNFSRHSSYSEIKQLIALFRPKSVYPCVAPVEAFKKASFRMRTLFGDVCDAGCQFRFDQELAISNSNCTLAKSSNSIQIFGSRPVKSRATTEPKHLHLRDEAQSEQDDDGSQESEGVNSEMSTLILELINTPRPTQNISSSPQLSAIRKVEPKRRPKLVRSNNPLKRSLALESTIRACRVNDAMRLLQQNQSAPWFDMHLDCLNLSLTKDANLP